MLNLFWEKKRIVVKDSDIYIDNLNENLGKAIEMEFVIALTFREVKVYENNTLIRNFRIEALDTNSGLSDQFLHCSVRILTNSAVMVDGVISKSRLSIPGRTDKEYEALRFQPFFLSNADEKNIQLFGKGLFERGLHFAGSVTPKDVRCICVCDYCKQSFTIQHFHAGFSEVQYFYSSNSREILIVPYDAIKNIPQQLQEIIDLSLLNEVESKLPKTIDGSFRYYNSFKCPHCLSPFIDFEANKKLRPKEYYGNILVNHAPRYWTEPNES